MSLVEAAPSTAYFWRAQDAADIADRWRQDLPPDRIHVVTVPPSGTDPDVLLDRFASVLGVDAATLTPERERVNVTLGVAQTELLRRVNVALGDRLPVVRAGYSRVAKVHLADQVLAAQEGERLQMPARLSSWCRERAEQIVCPAWRRPATPLSATSTTFSPRNPPRARTAPASTSAPLSQAAVEALAAMLDQRHHDLQRIDRLRRAGRRRPASGGTSPSGDRSPRGGSTRPAAGTSGEG